MGELTLLSFAAIVLQITFLEGILSIDNAAVLGAVVLVLPHDQHVPWPRALEPLGRVLNPMLGMQRTAALRVGLLGAYFGRGLMLVMASFIIHNPWLQFLGAAYLLKLAIENLGTNGGGEDEEGAGARLLERGRGKTFWAVVLTVELMDLAFSLDNVVVVISMSSDIWLVMLGVALGILTMRFAAGIFTKLIEKVPALTTAAYILVFNIGLTIVLSRLFEFELPEMARFAINVSILLLAVVYSKLTLLQRILHAPLNFISRLFYYLDRGVGYVLLPITWLLSKGWMVLTLVFTRSPEV